MTEALPPKPLQPGLRDCACQIGLCPPCVISHGAAGPDACCGVTRSYGIPVSPVWLHFGATGRNYFICQKVDLGLRALGKFLISVCFIAGSG